MNKLRKILSTVVARHPHWSVHGDSLTVPISETRTPRKQVIHLAAEGSDYLFTSTVVHHRHVTSNNRIWRNFALRAWRRNSEKDLVTFTFSEHDDLIGLIRHPRAHLDHQELEASLIALARECDRFEFVLTGADES